jgi:hypothetical protein
MECTRCSGTVFSLIICDWVQPCITIFISYSHNKAIMICCYLYIYTAKNDQVVAILMKTGLNNVMWPTLFTVVNNIEQNCYTRFRLNNIVQYCWQVWTMWAAQHCSILIDSRLIIFTRVSMLLQRFYSLILPKNWGWGWGCIFIYSCFARRISFESDWFFFCEYTPYIYMNIWIYTPLQLSLLATALSGVQIAYQ